MPTTTATTAVPSAQGPQQAAPMAGMNGILILMILFFGVYIFLTARSQKKRDTEHKQLIKNLVKDDKVVLMGGIVGTVAGFNGELLEIKISETVKISVLPTSIITVYKNTNGAK